MLGRYLDVVAGFDPSRSIELSLLALPLAARCLDLFGLADCGFKRKRLLRLSALSIFSCLSLAAAICALRESKTGVFIHAFFFFLEEAGTLCDRRCCVRRRCFLLNSLRVPSLVSVESSCTSAVKKNPPELSLFSVRLSLPLSRPCPFLLLAGLDRDLTLLSALRLLYLPLQLSSARAETMRWLWRKQIFYHDSHDGSSCFCASRHYFCLPSGCAWSHPFYRSNVLQNAPRA